MWQFLMVFYVIFFATGFMGGAALVLLNVRLGGSRLLRPLLLFQVLFLIGMGLILLYFSLPVPPTHSSSLPQVVLLSAINAINAAIWVVVIVLIRRVVPRSERGSRLPDLAEILAGLVALKSVANVVVTTAVLLLLQPAHGILAGTYCPLLPWLPLVRYCMDPRRLPSLRSFHPYFVRTGFSPSPSLRSA